MTLKDCGQIVRGNDVYQVHWDTVDKYVRVSKPNDPKWGTTYRDEVRANSEAEAKEKALLLIP